MGLFDTKMLNTYLEAYDIPFFEEKEEINTCRGLIALRIAKDYKHLVFFDMNRDNLNLTSIRTIPAEINRRDLKFLEQQDLREMKQLEKDSLEYDLF